MAGFGLILLALLCTAAVAQEEPYKIVIHESDPDAKCLDGTPPALYLHEGGDDKKFLIFFVGGGYCEGTTLSEVLESCYRRSFGDNGSSKDYKDQLISPGGYLSTDASRSQFATWTKIIIFYCDGAHHQGFNKDPISYKDTTLYFRGQANTKSHFTWIANNYKFAAAEKVLLTGASAGGIATFLYSNYVRSLLKNPDALYTVADSGAFMNATNFQTGTFAFSDQSKTLFQVSNADRKTPLQACNQIWQGEEYRCFFLELAFTTIQGRFMLINSEYDEVGLQGIGMTCLKNIGPIKGKTLKDCNSTEMSVIESYRRQYLAFVNIFMQFSKNSVWTISCCEHSYACYQQRYDGPELRAPANGGITPKEAIDRFVFQDERISAIDYEGWPNNAQCAY